MKRVFKKSVSILLTGAILASVLTGCGNPGQPAASTEAEISSTEAEISFTETETGSTGAETASTEAEAPSTGSSQEETPAFESPITVTDQIGREVTLDAPAEKLVSSYYISTALLIALGCEDNLAGIEMKGETRELYRLAAPELLELPAVGSGKGINVEETAALEPDVVIIPKRLEESVESFEALGIPVVVVNPETQKEFEDCINLLAQITATEEAGEELLGYYHEKMEFAREITKNADRPKVYLSSGSDYLRTCTSNMYQNDLIAMAGGENVSEELTDGYWTAVSAEQLAAWNPEYIFGVSYAEYDLESFTDNQAFAQVEAVKNNRVLTFPSRIEAWDYPTPSSILGILWLTSTLHPDLYPAEEYRKEAAEFYQKFFDIQVSDEALGL